MSVGEAYDLQLLIWGYAIWGDVCERTALLAETPDLVSDDWDRTATDLASSTIRVGGTPRPVPLWFGLRWLSQELMEQGIAELHTT